MGLGYVMYARPSNSFDKTMAGALMMACRRLLCEGDNAAGEDGIKSKQGWMDE